MEWLNVNWPGVFDCYCPDELRKMWASIDANFVQWYLQTVELQERLDMQTAMQTATLGIANLANSDSEVNTRNPKRFKAEKN